MSQEEHDGGSPVDGDAAPAASSATDDADAERARRLHERTGEIELIISGALVFGLFQVPGALDRTVQLLAPRLAEGQFVIVFMVSFYVRMVVLTLISAFLLHLVTRAYWVGLIGLDSVFPDGIHWDRIQYGPLAKDVYRRRVRRLSAMARRADNFGSSIFSFAFWISVLFVWSIAFGGFLGGVWYLVKRTLLPELTGLSFFVAAFVIAMIPSLAIAVDKLGAGRIDAGGRLARVLSSAVAGGYWVTGGPIFMPIQFTLFSRVPKKLIWPLFVGVFFSLIFGYLGIEVVARGGGRISGSEVYPTRPGPRTLVDDHYATSRSEASTDPYIQAPVIDDPYLEVVVPLVPLRMADRVEAACGGLEPAGRAGLVGGMDLAEPADEPYERSVLDCFGRIWTATLDGAPLEIEWSFRWEARFGPTALVAFVPVDGLGRGPHVLELREMPTPPEEGSSEPGAGETVPGGTPAGAVEGESGEDEAQGPTVRYIRFTT